MTNQVSSWNAELQSICTEHKKKQETFFQYLSISKNLLTSSQMVFSIMTYSAATKNKNEIITLKLKLRLNQKANSHHREFH